MSDEQKRSRRPEDPHPSLEQRRREKVEQFRLNLDGQISEEPTWEEETPLSGIQEPAGAPPVSQPQPDNLNSYSEEFAARQNQPPVLTKEEKKAEKAAVKAEKKRKKAKAKKNGCLFKMIWLIMVVLVAVVLSQYILVGVNDMLAVNRTDAETTVALEIPEDSNVGQVADILAESHIIENPSFFKLYATLTRKGDAGFTKGSYDIKTNMDYEAIINYLFSQKNRKDVVKITFYEGMNILEYARHLEDNNVCKADEFLAYCNTDELDADYPFLAAIDNKQDRYYKLEGYLFPDTYTYYEASEPEDVVRKMLNNYKTKTTTPIEFPGYDEPVSLEQVAADRETTLEAATRLASIIQLEAGSVDDMKTISSIFHNRLALSDGEANQFGETGLSRLGSDVTVFYPYKTKEQLPEDKQDFQSTYDTYNFAGLPAGPVCSPGLDSLIAALDPEDSSYYYFIYDKSETPVFYTAKTFEQHQANIEKAGLRDDSGE